MEQTLSGDEGDGKSLHFDDLTLNIASVLMHQSGCCAKRGLKLVGKERRGKSAKQTRAICFICHLAWQTVA